MKKKIIVTGGAGFIGSHIARNLVQAGHDVVVVDNLVTGFEENIPTGATFLNGDVSEKTTIESLPVDSDAVLHLAAQSSGEVSAENPDLDLKANTLSTLYLLQWCKENRIPRFVYASSMAIYGNVANNPVSEDHPCEPLSFYGISKLSSEHYIRHYASEGLKTTCFRMFSVYGPGQNMTNMKQGMVSIFLAYLMKGEEVWVKGSPDRFRDFIYIDDVVDAWCSCLDNEQTWGKTYNLATGKKTTVRELVTKEIQQFGGDPQTYPVKFEGSTPSDQFGLYADISRIRADLGWEPRYSLDEGLKNMMAWVKKEYSIR